MVRLDEMVDSDEITFGTCLGVALARCLDPLLPCALLAGLELACTTNRAHSRRCGSNLPECKEPSDSIYSITESFLLPSSKPRSCHVEGPRRLLANQVCMFLEHVMGRTRGSFGDSGSLGFRCFSKCSVSQRVIMSNPPRSP